MAVSTGLRIHITGIVQGVGFRPFVYGLATRLALTGWVRNTSAGVDIEVDGSSEKLQAFAEALRSEVPPLARIDSFELEPRPADGFTAFEIVHSEAIPDAFQPISPDVSICPDCLHELFDPRDRRYRYPFINCTNCGPRFTIIADLPYDRPQTTMAGFPLCPDCAAEYADPLDRRFHAQPVACPVCGPQVWLETTGSQAGQAQDKGRVESFRRAGSSRDAILETQRLLLKGKIVAVKGLGGFHLACDALNAEAVAELRRRKLRVDKPFALMVPDLETAREHCFLDEAEQGLLTSRARPVVILRRRPGSPVAPGVAPHQSTLGVMLPYTPLHYLLFSPPDEPPGPGFSPARVLVMTSGNLSEEPIATDNEEARQRLAPLADAFLMHDRPIHTRCDDSVVRIYPVAPGKRDLPAAALDLAGVYPLRRSRGYAPFPVRLPWQSPPLLAVGAELKNTFCITREGYAFLSQHIGDLENFETLQSFEAGVAHFERLFRVQPSALAYDLHPDYLATRYALERAMREGLPAVGVQHHHAHIAACLAENGWSETEPGVIGISFDGTGYGEDGAIWGGEFLIAGYLRYRRAAHLAYIPLPGGDRAIREPWRVALAWLRHAGIEWQAALPPVNHAVRDSRFGAQSLEVLNHQLATGLNAPPTSSVGRLFDAAAALAGVRQAVNYEAQAAIEFEELADPHETGAYSFTIEAPLEVQDGAPAASGGNRRAAGALFQIDPTPLFHELAADLKSGAGLPVISARFHNGLASMVAQVASLLRDVSGLSMVALSGGVWQNLTLLEKTLARLRRAGFQVYLHRQVPTNDGGLALGQAAVAAHKLQG